MNLTLNYPPVFLLVFILYLAGCNNPDWGHTGMVHSEPGIYPDYTGVTIPPNIAPLNFVIREDGEYFRVEAISSSGRVLTVGSKDGIIRFPLKRWSELANESRGGAIQVTVYSAGHDDGTSRKFLPFNIYVADDPVDPWLVYRSILPGYYSWSDMRIVQRSLESFDEKVLADNRVLGNNCMNCHSFRENDPDNFLIHVRGDRGGTYFIEDGDLVRRDLAVASVPAGATYPAWHPGGKFVAFSSNVVRQSFYAHRDKDIEVYDLASSLILFDRGSNMIVPVGGPDTVNMKTFPSWSPDGRYLYYSMAVKPEFPPDAESIRNIRYDLVRNSFDPETGSAGNSEIVFNASDIGKSASFPKISPDGRFLSFTLHDYGTFPVWNEEADLQILDIHSNRLLETRVNSNAAESYHSWGSNGKWLVFSSKRKDGRSSYPYFVHIDPSGNTGKPFVLPQQDPGLYERMLESFNLPELVSGRVNLRPRDFRRASATEAERPGEGDPLVIPDN